MRLLALLLLTTATMAVAEEKVDLAAINRIKTDPTLAQSEIRLVSGSGPAAVEKAPLTQLGSAGAAPATAAEHARAQLDPAAGTDVGERVVH